MSKKLVLATRNQGKVEEFRGLLHGFTDLRLLGLNDIADIDEVVEDGDTFQANARKKAFEVARASRLLALADDSGLEVDFINGAPGVRSARFAGEQASDEQNNRLLLSLLNGVPENQRTARFTCVLALADPEQTSPDQVHIVCGSCNGRILLHPRGNRGFGYDPIFLADGQQQSMAELSATQKNQISHRAQAARKMREHLLKRLA